MFARPELGDFDLGRHTTFTDSQPSTFGRPEESGLIFDSKNTFRV